jgi:hypothetical protein
MVIKLGIYPIFRQTQMVTQLDSTRGFQEFIRVMVNIENLGISLRILRCQSTKLSGDRVSLMWVNHGKPCCRVSANGLFLLATNAGISHPYGD